MQARPYGEADLPHVSCMLTSGKSARTRQRSGRSRQARNVLEQVGSLQIFCNLDKPRRLSILQPEHRQYLPAIRKLLRFCVQGGGDVATFIIDYIHFHFRILRLAE
jgi:hypothetical protein